MIVGYIFCSRYFSATFCWDPCCSFFYFFYLSYYVALCSEFRAMMSVTISANIRFSVRVYLQLFVGRSMSYVLYLCLFAYSGVQDILCCVFALIFFVLCTLCCKFRWILHFGCPFGIFSRLLTYKGFNNEKLSK
jgi:hypothetical protein